MVSVAGILRESKTSPPSKEPEPIDLLGNSYFVGYDEDGYEVVAVKSLLRDVGMVEMTGGGPFDGARCLIMSVEAPTHDEPVDIIFSDEDSSQIFEFCASFLLNEDVMYELDDEDEHTEWEWGYYDEDDDPETYL